MVLFFPKVFKAIYGVFGHSHLFPFANHANAKLPLYGFQVPYPLVGKHDMFQHHWDHLLASAFPLFAQASVVKSYAFDRTPVDSGGAIVAPQGVVCRPLVLVGRRSAQNSAAVGLTGAAPCAEFPSRPRGLPASLLEVV